MKKIKICLNKSITNKLYVTGKISKDIYNWLITSKTLRFNVLVLLIKLKYAADRVSQSLFSHDFRKKSGCQRSATSWLSVRLYVIAADRPQARIRTTTHRRPHPRRIPSLCFSRLGTPIPPRTITLSHPPSPTPPISTQRTARWAATTVTTARSHCCINRWSTGVGRQSHSAHWGHKTQLDTVTFTCLSNEHSSVVTLF